MLKKFIVSFCLTATASIFAIDSGTVSATLFYQLNSEKPDSESADHLFNRLLDQLENESVPRDVVDSVTRSYQDFLDGHDVKEDVRELWQNLTQLEEEPVKREEVLALALPLFANYNNIKDNPLIDSKHYSTIKPWILPKDHSMKAPLDSIFKASRAIKDKQAFADAGFLTFAVQPRSFIRVARHPLLPGYVVKVYLDTELRKKQKTPGWKWFARRCEGSKLIRDIIKRKKIKLFKAASKWIYPLPVSPKPPTGAEYDPKAEILIAQDMNIVSYSESLKAWKNVMTKAHLDELYVIIAYGNGHSYRPDNIPYSLDGKFAFVDTEYPNLPPNFNSPLRFLNSEMVEYWRQLINQGGPI